MEQGRGKKRRHDDTECTDSCDCEEFGLPLAKKINQMNIEYETSKVAQLGGGQFCQKYPFPKDSSYFSNNQLLNQLYDERIRRYPHLKHNPT